MENNLTTNTNNQEIKKSTSKLIKIIAILVVFIGLIVLAIIVFKQPVKVSFSAPGKMGFNLDSIVVDENGKITPPDESKLKLEHYEFLGWFKNAEGTGDPINLAEAVFKESTTVYAIWDVVEYTITYDLDGGKFLEGTSNPEFYFVAHDQLTKNDEKNNNSLWHLTAAELTKFIESSELTNALKPLAEPVNGNKVFAGWQILDQNGNPVKSNITLKSIRNAENIPGNIILKAIWN